MISAATENNPREIKRFINNYIVAYEIHSSNKEIDSSHLLIVQAINVRWNKFYQVMIRSNKKFFDEVKRYLEMQPHERVSQLGSDKIEEGVSQEIKMILRDFKSEDELWKFLKVQYDVILQIKDWDIYRRVAESVKEPTIAARDRSAKDYVERMMSYAKDMTNTISELKYYSLAVPPEGRDLIFHIDDSFRLLVSEITKYV